MMPEDISKSFVRPASANQSDHVVKDLSKLSKAQLMEMRDRQQDILRNKSRLAKLPDKGQRIEEHYHRIVEELRKKDVVEDAARLFSELNISSKGSRLVTNLEWTGDLKAHLQEDLTNVEDEDETDPLKIIAQARESKKIVRIEPPVESLITAADLKDFEEVRNLSTDSNSSQLDTHATYLCGMGDQHQLPNSTRIKFKPYQTTTSNVHDPQKEILKVFKHSEVTAATPPLLRHPGVKMLSLHDSLELQMVQNKEMKDFQQREAELRLAEKAKLTKPRDFVAKDMSEFFKSYRQVNESSDEADESNSEEEWDSAEEVLDIDAREEPGGVNFTVQE